MQEGRSAIIDRAMHARSVEKGGTVRDESNYYSICRSALESSGRALGNSFAVGWHMDCQSSQAVRRTCLMFLNQRLGQREPIERSEERRVGKECRSRWWRCV